MFEAMAAARPIVLAVEGEARALLERAGAGVAVPPGDESAIAGALERLARDQGERLRMGMAGETFVFREFSRAVWAERYVSLLARLPSTAGARRPVASPELQ
jgi:glycosyltransferase involved in cell wall biosynthesis